MHFIQVDTLTDQEEEFQYRRFHHGFDAPTSLHSSVVHEDGWDIDDESSSNRSSHSSSLCEGDSCLEYDVAMSHVAHPFDTSGAPPVSKDGYRTKNSTTIREVDSAKMTMMNSSSMKVFSFSRTTQESSHPSPIFGEDFTELQCELVPNQDFSYFWAHENGQSPVPSRRHPTLVSTQPGGNSSIHPEHRRAKWKTEYCRNYLSGRECPFGESCSFAHSPEELRSNVHPHLFRTRDCVHFWRDGFCPYGTRCFFRHIRGVDAVSQSRVELLVHTLAHLGIPGMETEEDAHTLGSIDENDLRVLSRRQTRRLPFLDSLAPRQRDRPVEKIVIRKVVKDIKPSVYPSAMPMVYGEYGEGLLQPSRPNVLSHTHVGGFLQTPFARPSMASNPSRLSRLPSPPRVPNPPPSLSVVNPSGLPYAPLMTTSMMHHNSYSYMAA